jgi:hypothetical protein
MVLSAQHIEIDIVDGVAQVTLGWPTMQAGEDVAGRANNADARANNADAFEAVTTTGTQAAGGGKNRWRLVISGGRLATWRFDGQKHIYYWRGATYFGGLRIYNKDSLKKERELRVSTRWKADIIIDTLECAV